MNRRPQPFPYQGSKRLLADRILALCGEQRSFKRLIEPFAGSAAMSIAALDLSVASSVLINDTLRPLITLWSELIQDPARVAEAYAALWREQFSRPDHYECVRARFNTDRAPVDLLYLLARCVKAALRFNRNGDFNQSADKRRLGMRPERFLDEAVAASRLLRRRCELSSTDFRDVICRATPRDLVYLDPPYEGVRAGDRRYHAQTHRGAIVAAVEQLNARRIPFLLSYDGFCGARSYGELLPARLELTRVLLPAGRSSQATLLARNEETVELVYVSRVLAESWSAVA